MMRIALLTVLVWAIGNVASAQDPKVWLIGGGAGIDDAQGQIESNVAWLERLLLERGVEVRTYFGLGPHPGKDSARLAPNRVPARGPLEPIARVFGEPADAALVFDKHELDAVKGSTLEDELVPALVADFERHEPGRDVLIVYNGHGGLNADDTRHNYLRLWDGGRLDVAELDAVLDALAPGTKTRFVMTQCYSGAFHSLIHQTPDEPGRIAQDRCGFFSESALEQAEGCSLVVSEDEYRDYSTYFFAALDGRTRLGEPIERALVDRDGDGARSFREAHLYTLAAAHSADIPRSTSEEYLMRWAPWYLRWDTTVEARSSEYWTIAEEVAARYGWQAAPDALESKRRELLGRMAQQRATQQVVEARVAELRDALAAAWLRRWPELGRPYSAAYLDVLDRDSAAIARMAAEDPRYSDLMAGQVELEDLQRDTMNVRRYLTQIDKIYHLRKLARLEAGLERFGSERDKSEYGALLDCENGGLD